MGKQERRAYLEAIRVRYRRAGKADKSLILNEFCAVCSYHRKYALRLLNRQYKANKRSSSKPGPSSRYDTPELIEALRTIWLTSINYAANGSRLHCHYGCHTIKVVPTRCQWILS
ncbi:MAG: hypothetical protein WCG35_04490 [Betaproteobacteria bacterium]